MQLVGFEGEKFHKFQKSVAIHENFTLNKWKM